MVLRATALNGWGFGRWGRATAAGVLTGSKLARPVDWEQHLDVRLSERAGWTDRMVPVYGPGARSAGVSNFLTVRPQTERSLIGGSRWKLDFDDLLSIMRD